MPILKPKDVIAVLAIMVLIALKIYQGEGDIDALVSLVLGYYFAKRNGGADNGV